MATTWTPDMVKQAERLWFAEALHGRPSAADANLAAERLAAKLLDAGERIGCTFDKADLRIETEPTEAVEGLMATIRWRPGTHEVELWGGGRDGELLTVQRVGMTVETARPVSAPTYDDPTSTVEVVVEQYRLWGWSETHRRWVYRQPR